MQKIIKNSLFCGLRALLVFPIFLILTPYILHKTGIERFGIWALVSVITAYAQLSDFGISTCLVKFIAEYHAKQDMQKVNHIINTAFVLYLALSGIVCVFFYLIMDWVVIDLLNIPIELRGEARFVFLISLLIVAVSIIFSIFSSILTGLQRFDYSNLVTFVSILLTAVGTFIFLETGYGLKGLVINNGLVIFTMIIFNYVLSKKILPSLRWSPFTFFNPKDIKQIFIFSINVQASNLANILIFQIDRILLSHFVSISSVSLYELGNRFISNVRSSLAVLLPPLNPGASELQAKDDYEMVGKLYYRSLKYIAALSIPLFLLVFVLANPLVSVWLGNGFEVVATTIQILSIAFLVNIMTGPGGNIIIGINLPQYARRSAVMGGILNLGISLFLVAKIGYYGVVIGIFCSLIMSAFYFFYLFHRVVKVPIWDTYQKIFTKPLLISLVLSSLIYGYASYTDIESISLLLLVSTLYFFTYTLLLLKFQYFDDNDMELITQIIPARLTHLFFKWNR